MLRPVTVALLFALPVPAVAETLLSETSGNWAGASGQGFTFLARLTQEEDMARLRIWSGTPDAAPTGEGDPDLDNSEIALGAFASVQTLEVVSDEDRATLHVITEFADEEAEGRVDLEIRYIDSQYTVTGYHYQEVTHEGTPYECVVDFQAGLVTEDGMEFSLSVDDEVTNASSWSFSTAFDRSICGVD